MSHGSPKAIAIPFDPSPHKMLERGLGNMTPSENISRSKRSESASSCVHYIRIIITIIMISILHVTIPVLIDQVIVFTMAVIVVIITGISHQEKGATIQCLPVPQFLNAPIIPSNIAQVSPGEQLISFSPLKAGPHLSTGGGKSPLTTEA